MKKVLLTGAAFVAIAASPAMAEGLDLNLAGHFKGYGVYNDEAGKDFSIRKETEVHFTGETTLDNGLTVGVHVEANVDGNDDSAGAAAATTAAATTPGLTANPADTIEESYMYVSGGWGRINLGEEDGAAYLLQVAAPSADSNVDGLRQYISASQFGEIDYAQDTSLNSNKVTYMTPVFSGFQMGASYVPGVVEGAYQNGTDTAFDTDSGLDDGYELAARYEGAYNNVGMAFGAGWGDYNGDGTTGDAEAWNVGLDLDFSGFGLGAAYTENEGSIVTPVAGAILTESETIVVGADYQLGAYKLGASWLNLDGEAGATDIELDRYTGGVSYAYGPGMSFRGSVSYIDNDSVGFDDETQVLLGTQVNF